MTPNLNHLEKLTARRRNMYTAWLMTAPGTDNRKQANEVMNGFLALNKIKIN